MWKVEDELYNYVVRVLCTGRKDAIFLTLLTYTFIVVQGISEEQQDHGTNGDQVPPEFPPGHHPQRHRCALIGNNCRPQAPVTP